MQKINIAEKFQAFSDHWSPKVIAEMNDYQFKLARVLGEFVWHDHADTDEVFIVIDGELDIEIEGAPTLHLGPGEMAVIPRNCRHKPVAVKECQIMLVEPRGTINTGETTGDLTAPSDVWI